MGQKATILTFGYGNRKNYKDLEEYFEKYNVKYLVDVRRYPRAWSRRWYAKQVSEFCQSKGVNYLSKPFLGNTSGNHHWIPPDPEKADGDLSEISKIAQNQTILLLCAEMDCKRCHRLEVANRLQEITKVSIEHLS